MPNVKASSAVNVSPSKRHAADGLRAEAADGALGSGPAGDDAEAGFGRTQFHVGFGDAEIGGGGEFQSAAQGVAIEGGDERHAQAGQRIKGAVAMAHPGMPEIFRRPFAPGFDIAAGAEGFFALAGDDGGADLLHAIDEMGRELQGQHHFIIQRVEFFRARDGDECDTIFDVQMNAFVANLNHGVSIPLLRVGTGQGSLVSVWEKL